MKLTMEGGEEPDCQLRLCVLNAEDKDCYGFHLSRTQWDPYPWVTGVEPGSAAEEAGLQPGDCLLEVNGEDVLGEKIGQVASRMHSSKEGVRLLLWNPGPESQTANPDVFTSPTPASILKFSSCLQSVMLLMECPVCLETIPPPAHQCCNGHLICRRCQSKSDRCPVCRVHFSRTRSLFADQVIATIRDTFGLALKTEVKSPILQPKLKHRLFFFKRHSIPNGSSKKASPVQMVIIPTNINTAVIGKDHEGVAYKPKTARAEALPGRCSRLSHNNDHKVVVAEIANSSVGFSAPGTPENLSDDDNSQPDFAAEEYHCPVAEGCCKVAGPQSTLTKHIQTQHEGPIVQYFSPRFSLFLPSEMHQGEAKVTTVCVDGKTFFLKLLDDESSESTLVWAWILGDEKDAEGFLLEVTLKGKDADTRANLCSPVFPLSSCSFQEILRDAKCVVIDQSLFQRYSKSDGNGRKRLEVNVRIHALENELSDDL